MYGWMFCPFLCGYRSMTLRLHMAFFMWQWEVFLRATDPSFSPITTLVSTVSQPATDTSQHNHLSVINLFCITKSRRVTFGSSTVRAHIMSVLCLLLSRQIVLQHPVQLWGHAGNHAALCSSSRGRTRPAGGCTSLPQWVGVRLVLHAVINASTLCSVPVDEPQSVHLLKHSHSVSQSPKAFECLNSC